MIIREGKTYAVDHSRKGRFTVRVLKVRDPFVDCEIIDGVARMMSEWNDDAVAGEQIAINVDLATFKEIA